MTRKRDELVDIAYDFIADCTCPQSVFEFAAELEQLGAHGAKIPKQRAQTWMKIINGLIDDAKLVERDGCVFVVADKNTFEQRLLF
jgi:hypothetical protein